MEQKYAIIGVEGNHDQAFVEKVLKLLNFKSFTGKSKDLKPFWEKFIPTYPNKQNLYKRLDMPSILSLDTHNLSVAIYVGEGDNLANNLQARMYNHPPYKDDIIALGIIADADEKSPSERAQFYFDSFKGIFPNFPNQPGGVDNSSSPATGIYIFPDNVNTGVLETIILECGEIIYPECMKRAISYLSEFSEEERKALEWKPFDYEKAIIATVTSVLKPGKTNTTSISQNNWISESTKQIPTVANFINFLDQLLELNLCN